MPSRVLVNGLPAGCAASGREAALVRLDPRRAGGDARPTAAVVAMADSAAITMVATWSNRAHPCGFARGHRPPGGRGGRTRGRRKVDTGAAEADVRGLRRPADGPGTAFRGSDGRE